MQSIVPLLPSTSYVEHVATQESAIKARFALPFPLLPLPLSPSPGEQTVTARRIGNTLAVGNYPLKVRQKYGVLCTAFPRLLCPLADGLPHKTFTGVK